MQGVAGPQGPRGLPGDGVAVYSGEMFDDCYSAFSNLSNEILRQMLVELDENASAFVAVLSDSDIYGVLRLTCFAIAAGEQPPFNDIWSSN